MLRRSGRRVKNWRERRFRHISEPQIHGDMSTQTRRKKMAQQTDLGGSFTLPGTSMILRRMGYGAMQLAGPEVWGPPRDIDGAVAVLQEAVATGVNHIDTSDFYGPHATNQIIKRALHPYREDLVIITKVGARRG